MSEEEEEPFPSFWLWVLLLVGVVLIIAFGSALGTAIVEQVGLIFVYFALIYFVRLSL